MKLFAVVMTCALWAAPARAEVEIGIICVEQPVWRAEFKREGIVAPQIRGGVWIAVVTPGSVAYRAGLRQFDLLWCMNGKVVSNDDEVYFVEGRTYVLEVFRPREAACADSAAIEWIRRRITLRLDEGAGR